MERTPFGVGQSAREKRHAAPQVVGFVPSGEVEHPLEVVKLPQARDRERGEARDVCRERTGADCRNRTGRQRTQTVGTRSRGGASASGGMLAAMASGAEGGIHAAPGAVASRPTQATVSAAGS